MQSESETESESEYEHEAPRDEQECGIGYTEAPPEIISWKAAQDAVAFLLHLSVDDAEVCRA